MALHICRLLSELRWNQYLIKTILRKLKNRIFASFFVIVLKKFFAWNSIRSLLISIKMLRSIIPMNYKIKEDIKDMKFFIIRIILDTMLTWMEGTCSSSARCASPLSFVSRRNSCGSVNVNFRGNGTAARAAATLRS